MYSRTIQDFILRDSPAQIDFHIRHDDYFAYLSTAMGFIEEAVNRCACEAFSEEERELVRALRRDLRYVQANYRVSERPLGEIQAIPRKGNLATQYR